MNKAIQNVRHSGSKVGIWRKISKLAHSGGSVMEGSDIFHPKYLYFYISVIQFFFLCISYDLLQCEKQENTFEKLSVPLRKLYCQLQRIIVCERHLFKWPYNWFFIFSLKN